MKTKLKRTAKRDLFAELSEGMTVLAEARQGKRTLRTHAVECAAPRSPQRCSLCMR